MSRSIAAAELDFEALLGDLSSEMAVLARAFKAFSRRRKIKSPLDLLRAVLLYSGLDQSLRQVAGTLTLLDERISASSVHERLCACGPWIKALLQHLLPRSGVASVDGMRFLLVDGSTVQGPGAKGIDFRLHLCLDLIALELVALTISDSKTGESLHVYPLAPGDVVVADRGYAHRSTLVAMAQEGIDFLVRHNAHNVPLLNPDGTPLDLAEYLKEHADIGPQWLPAKLFCKKRKVYQDVFVHAAPLPEEKANLARKQYRKQAKKDGRTPRKNSLFLAGWILLLTTLTPKQIGTEALFSLYRCRWQIELTIKRYKSLIDLGQLRAKKGQPLADTWLAGKLLYALILEKRLRSRMPPHWGDFDRPRTASLWRPFKLMIQQLNPIICGVQDWNIKQWSACLEVLGESPRKRTLQTLPETARAFFIKRQQNGQRIAA